MSKRKVASPGRLDSHPPAMAPRARIPDSANSFLAALWSKITHQIHYSESMGSPDPNGRANLNGSRWEGLLKSWVAQMSKTHGEAFANNKKGNLPATLSKPHLTWTSFFSALSILNADKSFCRIRFEVHFTTAVNKHTQVIGIDLYNKDEEEKEDPYVVFARNAGVPPLRPGDTAMPLKQYIPEGFNNTYFKGIVLQYTGTTPMRVEADSFDGLRPAESMIQDSAGIPSSRWVRLMGGDDV